MKQNPQDHRRILSASMKTIYNAVGKAYCPILGRDVSFTAKGFHHLSYKPDGTARSVQESIYKLTLVPFARPVIECALGIHDMRDIEMPSSRKKGAKRVKGRQYAIVANVGKKNPVDIRVIILELENGEGPVFWSIMKH